MLFLQIKTFLILTRFLLAFTFAYCASAQYLSVQPNDGDCALMLSGGAKSSAFDHNLNLLRGSL